MKITLTAALLVGASALATQAQEITLRVADSLPVDHYMTRGVLEPLMAQVREQTGDKVAFEHFPAEQLGGRGGQLLRDERLTAILAMKRQNRDPPGTLARQAPVRSSLDHPTNPFASP